VARKENTLISGRLETRLLGGKGREHINKLENKSLPVRTQFVCVCVCVCVFVCVEKKKTLLIGGKSLTDTPQGNGRR
jgi:hypothetical protein